VLTGPDTRWDRSDQLWGAPKLRPARQQHAHYQRAVAHRRRPHARCCPGDRAAPLRDYRRMDGPVPLCWQSRNSRRSKPREVEADRILNASTYKKGAKGPSNAPVAPMMRGSISKAWLIQYPRIAQIAAAPAAIRILRTQLPCFLNRLAHFLGWCRRQRWFGTSSLRVSIWLCRLWRRRRWPAFL
jgi:hypothetical protein